MIERSDSLAVTGRFWYRGYHEAFSSSGDSWGDVWGAFHFTRPGHEASSPLAQEDSRG
ncbi:hypothetical protein [Rubricoccus marinus]|uniref:hypothetical protein n=1 Tax=Rubricoccus marinus TaxID=716817 RepID=UPI0015C59DC9|nr:hypothetical protein [Rubricoccus marinus]